ncbi:MFS transporter [Micromonospora sp. NPDC049523]|uniref:MFS transporter n=1 Tax=Micromonospora sp. NPDC049523 TaxID=3155921 RepID=UPI003439E0B4
MDPRVVTAPGSRAGARQWLGLAVLALPTLLLSVDATVLYLALPHLGADLQPSSTQLLWIIDIYGFMIAGFLVTMGTLGDRIGRRRLLLVGAALFAVASVVAAYSTTAVMLVGARALLGIAGATLMPSTLALISNMFHDARQRGLAIGVWAACFSVGVAAGPLVGGALLEWYWWGSVFLLAVPVMLILLATAPVLLPECRDTEAGRLDLPSVALSLAAILPVIYGLKGIAEGGVAVLPLASMVLGVLFGVLFARRQRRLSDPLLDMRLFANRVFVGALTALLVGLAVVGVVYMLVTQYLQLVAGYSALTAGLWLLPSAAAMIISSMAAPVIARRIAPGLLVGIALGVSAVGYFLLAIVDSRDGVGLVVTGLVIVYLGVGPLMALGTDLVVGGAPPAKAGSAAALSETSMEFGLALGVAVLGSVGAVVYRSGMTDSMPVGLPPEAVDASRDALASVVAVAGDLPGQLGTPLLDAARRAFTDGLNVVGAVSGVLTVVIAVIAVVLLRDTDTAGAADGSDGGPEAEVTDAEASAAMSPGEPSRR